jgi:DNA-binding NarL/FixJ family response regulator
MINCTTCIHYSTCETLCDQADAVVSSDYKSLRELAASSIVEIVGSSCGHIPPETSFPEFPMLRPVENFVLRQFYADGKSYKAIAEKLNRPKNTIKSIIRRAKIKIASFSSYNRGAT